MGTFNWPMEILSADGALAETVDALVDTGSRYGSSYTVLPAAILRRLNIFSTDTLDFELGDGRVISLEVGEARVRVEGRERTRIVVFGDDDASPLMGADTLQGAALAVDPVAHRLVPTRALLKPQNSG